jgi:RNA polymerase sigma-70 factor (ECF subfamily)
LTYSSFVIYFYSNGQGQEPVIQRNRSLPKEKKTMSSNDESEAQEGLGSAEQIAGLYRYAMVLSHNHFEAEGLVEETYAHAIKTINRGSATSDQKAKLFAILRNIWINGARKQRIRTQIVSTDPEAIIQADSGDSHTNSRAIYLGEIEVKMVGDAIGKLSVESRELILLREYENFSYREIADILNCPMGAVSVILGKARSRLRILLSPLDRAKPEHRYFVEYSDGN